MEERAYSIFHFDPLNIFAEVQLNIPQLKLHHIIGGWEGGTDLQTKLQILFKCTFCWWFLSNVQSLQGSGPGGRVIAQDVTGATPVVAATASAPVHVPGKCKMELQWYPRWLLSTG